MKHNYKLLEFNQYQTSDNKPYIIYADLQYLITRIDKHKNNPENSSTTKIGEHNSMLMIWASDGI